MLRMKVIMTCKLCGHKTVGSEGFGLMNRIKLWNHLEKFHPERIEEFKDSLRSGVRVPAESSIVVLQAV